MSGPRIRNCTAPRSTAPSRAASGSCARAQRSDGGYPGFWGINFTYAIFHAVRGLRACGVPADDPVPTRAARWLIAAQRGDGGWGEHYSGCLEGRYVEHPESQVVMTAWALLALMDIVDPRSDAVLARARVAPAEAAAGWLLASAGRQRRVLRVGDAGLPSVQELFPGLGAGAARGPDAHRCLSDSRRARAWGSTLSRQ